MYRVYVKEPGKVKGHGIFESEHLVDARDAIDAWVGAPEGSYIYVRYGRPGYYEGRAPDKAIEAYRVEGGRPVRIFSRYGGGEWPVSWHLTLEESMGIQKEAEDYLVEPTRESSESEVGYARDLVGFFRERRRLEGKLGREVREESRRRYLEEGPWTRGTLGEKVYTKPWYEKKLGEEGRRLRTVLRDMGVERGSEEYRETFQEFGKEQ